MAKKLYIGNIPYDTTANELKEVFETNVGSVEEAFIVKDKETKKSKGFGFVTMAEDQDAINAIENNNDLNIRSRKLIISWARKKN